MTARLSVSWAALKLLLHRIQEGAPSGHKRASRMPCRDVASTSITGRNRRSAANWQSVPIPDVSACSKGDAQILDYSIPHARPRSLALEGPTRRWDERG